jgi:prevent-host-death family protein
MPPCHVVDLCTPTLPDVTTVTTFRVMKNVGIRELKTRLSEYLRQVRKGRTLLVTDHGEVVAELRPVGAAARRAGSRRLDEAFAAGDLVDAERPDDRSWLDSSEQLMPVGSAGVLLDAERGES